MEDFNKRTLVLFKLILLLVFTCNNINYSESYGGIPEICTDPSDEFGSCIPTTECKTFTDFLKNFQKPFPKPVVKKIQEYSCDDNDDSLVCCTSTPIEVDIPPPPPDVTQHPNVHLLPSECGYIDVGDKIRNGEDAGLFEFPWMALLSYNNTIEEETQFACGGSIINERYILTAAHCLVGTVFPLVGVRVGEYDLGSENDCDEADYCIPPTLDLPVEKIIAHPGFNKTSLYADDIGLVRVPKIDIGTYQAVCLPTVPEIRDQEFSLAVVSGWGYTEANRTTSTGVLQKVELPVQDQDTCSDAYRGKQEVKISHKQWCIGGADKKDTCQGDSGGPLQVASDFNGEGRYIQHGIVSFGHAYCGATGYPGVYTKVPYYMQWILDNIEP